jgi:hypothetical protein
MTKEDCRHFLRSILLYSVFTLCSLASKVPSRFFFLFSYLPNLDILFLYCYFFVLKQNTKFIYLHLFLLGLIIDTFNFLPIGLNSLALLLIYKVIAVLNRLLFMQEIFLFFLRDSLIFLTLYFILTWFLLSLYRSGFIPFMPILMLIVKNTVYLNFGYFAYKKIVR